MTLDMLMPGQEALVTAIGCREPMKARLADMGLISGTRVRCRCRGSGLSALQLRGAVVAIRLADLGTIAGRRL